MDLGNEKKQRFITLTEAAKNSPYSQEYLSLLARRGKLFSKKIGRNWFTTREAVQNYLAEQGLTIIIPKSEINSSYQGKILRPIVMRPQIIETSAAFPGVRKDGKEEEKKERSEQHEKRSQLMEEFEKLNLPPQPVSDQAKISEKPEIVPLRIIPPSVPQIVPPPLVGLKSRISPAQLDATGNISEEIFEKETKIEKVEEALVQISKNLDELSQLQKAQIERRPPPVAQLPVPEISSEQKEFFEIESKSFSHRFRRLNYFSNQALKNPKKLLGIVITAIVLLFLVGGGFSFGQIDVIARRVSQFFKDADTLQGHFAGTHANEVLLLDKAGNVSIFGHIETQGQLRSFAPDGVAPITVDSTTLVENLNAEYLDGLASKDFTLAFVTKNGNVTYEDVYLEGNVEVGKTLLVKGATKLLDSLSVYGKLGVFGEAVFGKDVKLTSGNLNVAVGNLQLGQGTIEINSRAMIKNLNSEFLQGYRPGDFTLDYVVSNGDSTDRMAFFNGGMYGGDGAFSSLGVAGDVSIGSQDGAHKHTVTIFSKKFSVDSSGNLTASGKISGGTLSVGPVVSDLIPSGSYDLGSSANPWDELIVSSASIGNIVLTGNVDLNGTESSSFVINTDNVSSDSEDAYLAFERGAITPNAQLLWNSTGKRFEFNEPVRIASTSLTAFTVSGGAASLSNALFIENGGNVGIGTTSPMTTLDVIGNASISGNLEISGNIIGGAVSYSTASISGNFEVGGIIKAADGTAVAPSYTFKNDLNTGLYRQSNDYLGITTGGTEIARFGSLSSISNTLYVNTGNVGIGTTAPTATLTVNGQAEVSTLYENQPLIYSGRKVSLLSPYTSKAHVYKGQMHDHTTNSDDGVQSPTALVTAFRDAGYNFISITDHDFNTPDPGVSGILFIPGIEETSGTSHLNRINTATNNTGDEQSAIDQSISEGSFVFLNHPNYLGYPPGFWTDTKLEAVEGYYGIEVWNSLVSPNNNAENRIDHLLSRYRKVYLIANDDCHDVNASYCKTASTNVFADSLTLSDVMENLKRGNFYASNGANISSISVSQKTITVSTDAASTIAFITDGGTVKQSTASVTTASYTVFGDEVYVRVRVTRDSDGKMAWTNPIYVLDGPVAELARGGVIDGNLYASGSAIFRNGNVGIGTTSPLTKLEIQGTASASNLFTIGSLQIGSGAAVATASYNRFGTYVTTHTNYISANNDLLISGDLEGRGSLSFAGPASLSNTMWVSPGGYSGNVGIGTTSPGAKLYVVGTGGAVAGTRITVENTSTDAYAAVKVGNDSSGGVQNIFMVSSGTTRASSHFGVNNSSAGVGTGHLYTNASPLVIGTNDNFNLTLGANGVGIMTLTPSGNVGIGNTTPDAKLDVTGNILASTSGNVDLILKSTSATVNDGKFIIRSASTNDRLEIMNGTTPTSLVTIASTGNVGIGTTAPGSLLHITAATRPILSVETTGTTEKARFGKFAPGNSHWSENLYFDGTNWNLDDTAAGGSVLAIGGAVPLYFRYTSAGANPKTLLDYFAIMPSGNVGIRTTSPTSLLTVQGRGEFQGTASASYLLTGNTLQVGGYASVAYNRFGIINTSHSGAITTTNDVLINGDLEVDGSVYFDGTTNFSGIASSAYFYAQPGSASSPSFSFAIDQDTGMFRPAVNELAFSSLGSERVRINPSGNVGIGDASPEQKLTVTGSILASASADDAELLLRSVSNDGLFAIRASGSAGVDKLFITNGTNNTPLVTIASTGDVGIGTTELFFPFEVAKDGILFSGTTMHINGVFRSADQNKGVQLGYDTSGTIGVIAASNIGGNLSFWTHNGSSWGERVRIQSDGNVGIGNTTPDTKFDVTGTASASLFYAGTAGSAAAPAYSFSQDVNTGLFNPGADLLAITTNSTERIRIDDNGNIGIGTSNLETSFELVGAASISGNLRLGGIQQTNGTASSGFEGPVTFHGVPAGTAINQGTIYLNPTTAGVNNVLLGVAVGSSEKVRIDSEGDIQIIGTYNSTNTSGTNQFSGNLQIDGNTTLGNATSDTITATGRFNSGLIPSADITYNLGSPDLRWESFFVASLSVSNLIAGGTASSAFIINADNATNDAEDSQLEFERGTAVPNAILKWDSANDRLDFNFPVNLQGTILGQGTASSSFAGPVWFTGTPTGTGLQQGSVYINPSTGTTDYTIFGIGVNGVQRFRVDAEGDTTVGASLTVTNGETIQGITGLVLSGVGAPITLSGTGIHILSASSGTLQINAFTLGGDITGNSQNITGINHFQATTASISGNFDPSTDNSYDLGDPSYRWRDAYFSRNVGIGIAQNQAIETPLEVNGTASLSNTMWVSPGGYTGNVGIGNTTPDAKLDVTGNILASTSGNVDLTLKSTTSDDTNFTFRSVGASNRLDILGSASQAYMTILKGGNVGIGTTSPGSMLHVRKNQASQTAIKITNLNVSDNAITSLDFQTIDSDGYIQLHNSLNTFGPDRLLVSAFTTAAGLDLEAQATTGDIRFFTGGVAEDPAYERLRIDYTGNVGIGNTSPNEKLDVTGNIIASASAQNVKLTLYSKNTSQPTLTEGMFSLIASGTAGLDRLQITNGSANTALVTIASTGNVGIGTTSPRGLLHIAVDNTVLGGGQLILSGSTDVNKRILIGFNTTENYGQIQADEYSVSTRPLILNPNGGNVGIGTTSPLTKLEIQGTASASNLFTVGSLQIGAGATTATVSYNRFGIGITSHSGSIAANNDLLISGDLEIDGNAYFDGTTNFTNIASSAYFYAQPGTAASPSFSFAIDQDTGMFRPSVNELAFSSLGSERVRINPAGNMGIGTDNPSLAKLQVAGDVYTTAALGFYVAGEGGARNAIYRGGTDFTILRNYNQLYTIEQIWSPPGNLSTEREATLAIVRGDEPDQEYIDIYNNGYVSETQFGIRIQKRGTGAYRDFVFDQYDGAAKTPLMILKAGGNVGIGNTSPNEKLDVTGNILASSSIDTELILNSIGTGTDEGKFSIVASGAAGIDKLFIRNGTAETNLVTIASIGNVGIGTTSPGAKLYVVGTGGAVAGTRITVENTSTDAYAAVKVGNDSSGGVQNIFMVSSGTTRASSHFGVNNSSAGVGTGHLYTNASPLVIGTNNDFNLTLGANGVGIMTLTPSGNVGIGNTTPDAKLDVTGNILASTSGNVDLILKSTSATVNDGKFIIRSASTNDRLEIMNGTTPTSLVTIASTGNVGIGNTSPDTKLDVTGNIIASASAQNVKLTLYSKNTSQPTLTDGMFSLIASGTAGLDRLQITNGSANTALVTIASTGNVGIGNTSPTTKLNVTGSASVSINFEVAGNASASATFGSGLNIMTGTTGCTSPTADKLLYDFSTGKFSCGTDQSGGSAFTGLLMGEGTTTKTHIDSLTYSPSSFDFSPTASAGILTLDYTNGPASRSLSQTWTGTPTFSNSTYSALLTGGNVGIGNTSPDAKLDVTGNILASASGNVDLILKSTDATGTDGQFTIRSSGASDRLDIFAGATVKVTIASSGNVGIGETIPGAKLEIAVPDTASNVELLRLNNPNAGGNGSRIDFTQDATLMARLKAYYISGSDYTFDIGTLQSPSTISLNNGNVGIGDTFPTAKLEVSGGTASLSNTMWVSPASYTGNVGIGTTGPTAKLQISAALTKAFAISDAGGTVDDIFTVDTTASANAGIDITAGTNQTGNLFNLKSSAGTVLANFSYAGGLNINIASTSALIIKNGGVNKFVVDSIAGTASVSKMYVGLTAATAGTGTPGSFALCHPTNGASATGQEIQDCTTLANPDYQETYPMESDIEVGDILVPSSISFAITSSTSSMANTKVPYLQKSSRQYQPSIIGVASNPIDSGDFNTIGGNIRESDNPRPLALAGRVMVKVNLENGPIKIGDPITSSSTPGVGMKATVAGSIIGMALESLDSVAPNSYQRILIFISSHYYGGNVEMGGQIASTMSGSGLFDSLLNIAGIGSNVEISHTVGFENLSLKAVKEVIIDAPLAMVKDLWAKGNIIIEGIKKTYYAAVDLFPNVDINLMAENWLTREIEISQSADTESRTILSGSGAQAADQSRLGLEENGNYLATYGVDSTRGEVQLSGSSDLLGGEAKIYFDYSFTAVISDKVLLKVLVTPTTVMQGQIYVAQKTIYGFVVRGLNGASEGKFDWLVIARRKGYEGADASSTASASANFTPTSTPPGTPVPSPAVSGSPATDTPTTTPELTPAPTPEITPTPTPSATPEPTPTLPIPSPTPDVGATESSILDLSAPSNDGGQIGTTPEPTPELTPAP